MRSRQFSVAFVDRGFPLRLQLGWLAGSRAAMARVRAGSEIQMGERHSFTRVSVNFDIHIYDIYYQFMRRRTDDVLLKKYSKKYSACNLKSLRRVRKWIMQDRLRRFDVWS